MSSYALNVEKTPPSLAKKKVIIIGAGVGGLATAARLSRAGLDVTVIEKNEFSGGRCSLIHKNGFRFDRGPSFYLMPEVFEDLFDDLNETVSDWYELKKCEPNYVLHFDDRETFTLSSDLPKMKAEIERFEGKPGWARFLKFMAEGQSHYETSIAEVLSKNYPSFLSILKPRLALTAIKIHVFDKLHRRARNYFWTDRLRRAFTFSSMYLGMSPYDAPATYNLLQYTELAQGVWYPIGGFHRLPQALESITKKNGGRILYSSPVKRILISSSRTQASSPFQKQEEEAEGVELETGEKIYADAIISNADLVWTYQNLLPTSHYSKSLERSKLTCSSISFYWAINRKLNSLVTHQVYLAKEYRKSFEIIFDQHDLPNEPSFYINLPSRIDPSSAPEGKDAMIILVPLGHLTTTDDDSRSSSIDWKTKIDHARDFVLKTIESHLLDHSSDLKKDERFEDLIEFEIVQSPENWKEDFNLYKGSILGLSHHLLQVINFRPKISHDSIKRMYFVGASTHPGTGVPVVTCGSKLTSEAVLQDFKISIPWSKITKSNRSKPDWKHSFDDQMKKKKTKLELDRTYALNQIQKPWTIDFEENLFFLCLLLLLLVLMMMMIFVKAFNLSLQGFIHLF